jgi:lipopolysaccharide export system protein LptA
MRAGRRIALATLVSVTLAVIGGAGAWAQTPPKAAAEPPKAAAGAASAPAGNAPANPNESQPIQIQANNGIEWQQNAQVYIARGNAVATRGNSELHGETLVAHYRPLKPGAQPVAGGGDNQMGNTEIYRVDADGGVMLKREAQTVVGDHLVYDVDKGIAVITGKALKMTTTTDTVTARDSLEWYDQKQVAVARGDAVAIRNGKTIKADILTAYMVKSNPPAAGPNAKPAPPPKAQPAAAKPGVPGAPGQESKISRVDAQGHVVVTNERDTGRGDYAVYNAVTGISTLIGNVVLTRANDVMRGQSAVMDMNNNVSRILPSSGAPGAPPQRVQGLFVREDANKALGAGKGPAPATASPAKSP